MTTTVTVTAPTLADLRLAAHRALTALLRAEAEALDAADVAYQTASDEDSEAMESALGAAGEAHGRAESALADLES